MSTLRIAFIPGDSRSHFRFYQLALDGCHLSSLSAWNARDIAPEGSCSYITASLLHVLAAIGIACLFTLVVRFKVGIFAVGFQGSFYFAICIWGALALPILLESAIFVRLHRPTSRLATTSMLACAIIRWWLKQ
jgi:hypothetical protein